MIGNALPNQLQRYYIFLNCARIVHIKIAICVRKHKWRFCRNLKKTHFFHLGGLREFSRCSQGRLSVKLGNGSRNEKKTNLNNCYFLQKNSHCSSEWNFVLIRDNFLQHLGSI